MTNEGMKAVRRALNIIAYAPNTEAQLTEKLLARGHGPGSVKEAIAYLRKKGYIDERAHLYRLVEQLGNVRGYGRSRIFQALKQKSFNDALIDECFEDACAQVDFGSACAKKIAADKRTDKDKILTSLRRYGYDYTTIKAAYKRVKEEHEQE